MEKGCLNLNVVAKSKSFTANITKSGVYALTNNNIPVKSFGFIAIFE
jgi:hypothetical protein